MSETVPALEAFGRRIMILGPSNSGKSTLAFALGRRLDLPVVHLDLLRHAPGTDWQPRPDTEFAALHAAAIAEPEWVMEGNYGELFQPRLERATGIVVLDDTLVTRYRRYFRRSLFERGGRIGGLAGDRDSVKWAMIHWLWVSRHSARRYNRIAAESGLPSVFCHDSRQLADLFAAWGLERATQPS
jgi:adenylate kinase family enzyme